MAKLVMQRCVDVEGTLLCVRIPRYYSMGLAKLSESADGKLRLMKMQCRVVDGALWNGSANVAGVEKARLAVISSSILEQPNHLTLLIVNRLHQGHLAVMGRGERFL